MAIPDMITEIFTAITNSLVKSIGRADNLGKIIVFTLVIIVLIPVLFTAFAGWITPTIKKVIK